jgi:hypothetical protein
MKVAKFPIIILVVLGFLIVLPTQARAEWFGDFYLGEAFTEEGEVNSPAFVTSITKGFGSSLIIGLRIGKWLENTPWLGFAMDYSIFNANISHRDIFISPISFLAMVRMQWLKSTEFPRGRLQPYFGAGPALFYSEINSFSPFPWGPINKVDDPYTSIDLGLDLRVGLAWSITNNLTLFGEYRLSTFESEFEENIYLTGENMEAKLTTHHGLAGISYRF